MIGQRFKLYPPPFAQFYLFSGDALTDQVIRRRMSPCPFDISTEYKFVAYIGFLIDVSRPRPFGNSVFPFGFSVNDSRYICMSSIFVGLGGLIYNGDGYLGYQLDAEPCRCHPGN